MKSKKFLLFFSVYLILFLSIVGITNFIFDPYGVFRYLSIEGVNAKKIDSWKHGMLKKIQRLKFNPPECIILGNSRVERGYGPDSGELLKDKCNELYNAGSAGFHFYEILRVFQNVLQSENTKLVFVQFDFLNFNAENKVHSQWNDDLLLYRQNGDYFRFASITGTNSLLFSIDTLINSLLLPSKQNLREPYLSNDALSDYVQEAGYSLNNSDFDRFLKNEKAYSDPKTGNYFPDGAFNFVNKKNDIPKMLGQFFEDAYKSDKEIKIIIGALHSRMLLLQRKYDLYSKFKKWKTLIVEKNEYYSKKFSKKPIEVWDFAYPNFITTEKLSKKSGINMKYYWEGSHFKKPVGKIIIEKIMNFSNLDIGRIITKNNLSKHLLLLDEEVKKFEKCELCSEGIK